MRTLSRGRCRKRWEFSPFFNHGEHRGHGGIVFERYTEDARRAVFFARFEAAQSGSPFITSEFLLLGLIHDDYSPFTKLFPLKENEAAIPLWMPARREKSDPSVDLPLSNGGKRVLAYAAEEAELLKHKWIGSEHILLGIFR